MDRESWQTVETIFHTALEYEGDARQDYLLNACRGDENLRDEVESLISAFDHEADFLDEPVFNLSLQAIGNAGEKSFAGQQIGVYQVGDKLGSGGMGDVYLATDTRLNRKVALKFLSAADTGDEWSRKLFLREAQAVARLDHPNICTIYGIEETDGLQFIAMQYIEGETLSHLLGQGKITSDRILPIARQIAEALAAAHERGIIHRDIKPGNIMITPQGQVKVLDFGLAKIVGTGAVASDCENPLSQKGLIMGTVAYMSPEQLKAQELDYRTDIFSLGTLLAEVSGTGHPFARESDAETISAILRGETRYIINQTLKLPAGFQRTVKKCLENDREKRFQSAADFLLELENLEGKDSLVFPRFFFRAVLATLLLLSIFFAVFIYQRAVRVRTLAVFPFINESKDNNFEYLSNGMAEDFINRLSASDKLRVKAFTFVSGYKNAEIDPVKTGRELNVDAVLTGKIVQVNNQTVLYTKLIDTSDGTQIWNAENILQDSNILALQTDISERVINRLQPWGSSFTAKITAPEKNTDNPEAFKLYLKGRYFWQKRDKENIPKAIAFFQQAIEADPSFAKAHAGLADSYVLQSQVAYGSSAPRESMRNAKAAAKKAIEIDNASPEAHTSLGVVLMKSEFNWVEAEKEYRQAIEFNPEYAPAHYWLSVLLSLTGRSDEAMVEGLKARELEPFSQVSKINVARIYVFAKRYDEALQTMLAKDENALESNFKTQYMIGGIYIEKGMYTEAREIFEDLYARDKSLGGAMLGYLYGKMGKRQEALAILAEMEKGEDYFPPTEKAFVLIGLNEKKKALAYVREAVNGGYGAISGLKVEPAYLNLSTEPEYYELLKQMGLDKY